MRNVLPKMIAMDVSCAVDFDAKRFFESRIAEGGEKMEALIDTLLACGLPIARPVFSRILSAGGETTFSLFRSLSRQKIVLIKALNILGPKAISDALDSPEFEGMDEQEEKDLIVPLYLYLVESAEKGDIEAVGRLERDMTGMPLYRTRVLSQSGLFKRILDCLSFDALAALVNRDDFNYNPGNADGVEDLQLAKMIELAQKGNAAAVKYLQNKRNDCSVEYIEHLVRVGLYEGLLEVLPEEPGRAGPSLPSEGVSFEVLKETVRLAEEGGRKAIQTVTGWIKAWEGYGHLFLQDIAIFRRAVNLLSIEDLIKFNDNTRAMLLYNSEDLDGVGDVFPLRILHLAGKGNVKAIKYIEEKIIERWIKNSYLDHFNQCKIFMKMVGCLSEEGLRVLAENFSKLSYHLSCPSEIYGTRDAFLLFLLEKAYKGDSFSLRLLVEIKENPELDGEYLRSGKRNLPKMVKGLIGGEERGLEEVQRFILANKYKFVPRPS